MTDKELDLLRWAVQIVVPALAGFVGILAGAWLTARRERTTRRYAFLTQQLQALYGPLLGMRNEIRALSEMRETVSEAANAAWAEISDRTRSMDPDRARDVTRERGPDFQAIIEYDNTKLREVLLPRYRQMLDTFRGNLGLARPESLPYFATFVHYLDVWDRAQAETLPYEVRTRIGHAEASLTPLYEHIERTVDELRNALATGKLL
jgi:hypothetical protein